MARHRSPPKWLRLFLPDAAALESNPLYLRYSGLVASKRPRGIRLPPLEEFHGRGWRPLSAVDGVLLLAVPTFLIGLRFSSPSAFPQEPFGVALGFAFSMLIYTCFSSALVSLARLGSAGPGSLIERYVINAIREPWAKDLLLTKLCAPDFGQALFCVLVQRDVRRGGGTLNFAAAVCVGLGLLSCFGNAGFAWRHAAAGLAVALPLWTMARLDHAITVVLEACAGLRSFSRPDEPRLVSRVRSAIEFAAWTASGHAIGLAILLGSTALWMTLLRGKSQTASADYAAIWAFGAAYLLLFMLPSAGVRLWIARRILARSAGYPCETIAEAIRREKK